MSEKTVPAKAEKNVATTREEERYLRPPVDIYEQEDKLVVVCDMPGVSQEDICVGVDNSILTIEGKVKHDTVGESVYSEFGLINYFRQFELSNAIAQEKIQGILKNGVLTVNLFKEEKAKPRKVTIQVE